MRSEEWRPVIGFEGLYSVSNWGRVRSEERIVVRRDGVHQPIRERILQPAICGRCKKFRKVHLADRGRKRTWYVHRLVKEAFGAEVAP